jgi:hypothetical protein
MVRRATFSALFGILLHAVASPAAEKVAPDERAEAIELLIGYIKRTVPTASVSAIAGEGSAIILCGTVAHVEDVDTVLTVARAVWGGYGRQVICGLKVGSPQQVQIDLKLYRIDRAGAEAGDGELYRRYLESFGNLRAASQIEQEQDLLLLQHLKSIGQAEFLAQRLCVNLSGRVLTCNTKVGDCGVPDVSGFGGWAADEWLNEDHLKGSLQFLPVVLGDGRIRLTSQMEDSDRKVFPLGTIIVEDGETAILAAPDEDLEIHGNAGDLVLLATVHISPTAP